MSNTTNPGATAPHSLGSGLAALRARSGWIIAFGVALLVFGAIALGSVLAATVATVFYVGVMMLVSGVSEIVLAFQAKSWGKFFLWVLLGVLYGFAGFFTLSNPVLAAGILTLFLGASLVASGVVRIILAFQMKEGTAWGWVVFSGVITALLGLVILAHWPFSSLYVLGIFLGVDLMLAGISWITIGMALKGRKQYA